MTTGDFRDFFVSFINRVATAGVTATPATNAASASLLLTPEKAKPVLATPAPSTTKGKSNKKKKNKKQASPTAAAASAAEAASAVASMPSSSSLASDSEHGTSTCTVSVEALKKIHSLDWEDIFLSPGMPRNLVDYSNSLSTAVDSLAERWLASASTISGKPTWAAKANISSWSSQQTCIFLEHLLLHSHNSGPLPETLLLAIEEAYSFGSSGNAEICFRWQMVCLASNCAWIVAAVVSFITSQGRMKFVRPLYRALKASKCGGIIAVQTFDRYRDMYHPIARKVLAHDVGRDEDPEDASDDSDEEDEEVAKTVTTSTGVASLLPTPEPAATKSVEHIAPPPSIVSEARPIEPPSDPAPPSSRKNGDGPAGSGGSFASFALYTAATALMLYAQHQAQK